MAEILAHHSGRPVEEIERDLDRDFYLSPLEAREYGLIDEIILPRRGVAAPPLAAPEALAS
jgi:ATP-dependent Clp protease protease subunit